MEKSQLTTVSQQKDYFNFYAIVIFMSLVEVILNVTGLLYGKIQPDDLQLTWEKIIYYLCINILAIVLYINTPLFMTIKNFFRGFTLMGNLITSLSMAAFTQMYNWHMLITSIVFYVMIGWTLLMSSSIFPESTTWLGYGTFSFFAKNISLYYNLNALISYANAESVYPMFAGNLVNVAIFVIILVYSRIIERDEKEVLIFKDEVVEKGKNEIEMKEKLIQFV